MNSINIGLGTPANIITGLVSIGFTQDQTYTDRVYWSNDTNGKIYFEINNNNYIYLMNSSGVNIGYYGGYWFDPAINYKITYETIGNSIFWGYTAATDNFNYLHFGIIEPESNNDDWLYTFHSDAYWVYNGATETPTGVSTTSLYPGAANGVQVVKYYDGFRFVDNLYITAVCGNVPGIGTSLNNYAEATIGNDTYFIYKPFATYYSAGHTAYAVKRPAAAAAST